jgi:uncharacterized protein (DUF58 family)
MSARREHSDAQREPFAAERARRAALDAKHARGASLAVPCPRVAFAPDFLARLERFAARVTSARERREGTGVAAAAEGGHEFVGHRLYRAGDDLRALDWDLLARLDRPYVRVTRRESGERWLVWLDTSASMGVGPPGKLQHAAEVAAAIACIGLRLSAEVSIVDVGAGRAPRELSSTTVRKRGALPDLLAFLEARTAEGVLDARVFHGASRGGRSPGSGSRGARSRASRVFVVGDLLSVTPADVLPLARGTSLCLVQILAPIELDAETHGDVEWWDPETQAKFSMSLDDDALTRYAVDLEGRLDAWRAACAARRVAYVSASSALAFEDVLHRVWSRGAG